MALSFMPEIATFKDAFVTVETKGEYTDGQTVSEFNESIMGQIFKPKPNSEVALDIDVDAFNAIFQERVLDFLINLYNLYDFAPGLHNFLKCDVGQRSYKNPDAKL